VVFVAVAVNTHVADEWVEPDALLVGAHFSCHVPVWALGFDIHKGEL
jgi:hypothetical protein